MSHICITSIMCIVFIEVIHGGGGNTGDFCTDLKKQLTELLSGAGRKLVVIVNNCQHIVTGPLEEENIPLN
uniref:Uncharacterized protein n=1 Tax=Trichobilharzia regenti TaxID=157069 RepID=A0AA85IYW9_TRIRE|nr:unnamed protein product [Trichobilharzia regenti]